MIDIHAIREGLATALRAVDGVSVVYSPFNMNALPCAVVNPPEEVTYGITMGRGVSSASFTIDLVVGRFDDLRAHEALDRFASLTSDPASIPTALIADRTLGGACSTLVVRSAESFRGALNDTQNFLAVSFTVEVHV